MTTNLSTYDRAHKTVEQLEARGIEFGEDRAVIVYTITEAITDALIAQVDHAREQVPTIHVHLGDLINATEGQNETRHDERRTADAAQDPDRD